MGRWLNRDALVNSEPHCLYIMLQNNPHHRMDYLGKEAIYTVDIYTPPTPTKWSKELWRVGDAVKHFTLSFASDELDCLDALTDIRDSLNYIARNEAQRIEQRLFARLVEESSVTKHYPLFDFARYKEEIRNHIIMPCYGVWRCDRKAHSKSFTAGLKLSFGVEAQSEILLGQGIRSRLNFFEVNANETDFQTNTFHHATKGASVDGCSASYFLEMNMSVSVGTGLNDIRVYSDFSMQLREETVNYELRTGVSLTF